MHTRTLVLLVAALCSLAFIVLNWTAIATPGAVSLGLTTVFAPVGVILLGMLVVLSVLFTGQIARLQKTLLVESRLHAKELGVQRALADNAEVSRFTELRTFLDQGLRQVNERNADRHAALQARLDAQDVALRAALDESGNGMAAQIGELEDRLERHGYRSLPEGVRTPHIA